MDPGHEAGGGVCVPIPARANLASEVTSLVLCSASYQVVALREIRRVLGA